MPVRCVTSQWQITLTTTEPVTTSPRQVTLRFQIENVTGTATRGRVFNLEGTIEEQFTGTCRVLHAGDVNRMSFVFPWARAHINLIGIAFTEVSQPNTFVGSFAASARTDLRELKEDLLLLLPPPPEEGDVGVGNGTQT